MTAFKALPEVSTLQLGPMHRALGRLIDLDPGDTSEPLGQVQRDLAADAFFEYFQADAQARDPLPESRSINRRLLDWAKEGANWKAGKEMCTGNLLTSSVSAGLLYQLLSQDEAVQEALKKEQEAQEAAAQAAQQQAMADALEQAGDPAAAGHARQKAQAAQAAAQAAQAAADQTLDDFLPGQRAQAVRAQAIQEAKHEAAEVQALATGWGLEPGSISAQDVKPILETLRSDYAGVIEDITRAMGRVKGVAMNVKAKKVRKSGVIVQDGYTQRLPNIFPGELAMLRPDFPVLQAQKFGEFADRGLIGMVEGDSTEHEGDLIIAVDESGSMQGDRQIRAKALALGIAQAAKETTGQNFNLFGFDDRVLDTEPITQEADWQALIQWAARCSGGGTSFDNALEHALDILDSLQERAENADLCIITDGEADCHPPVARRYLEARERYGCRLILLNVNSPNAQLYRNFSQIVTTNLGVSDQDDLDRIAQTLTEAFERPEKI